MPKYTFIFSSHIIVEDVEVSKKEDAIDAARKLYDANPTDYDLASRRHVSVKRQRGGVILPNES